MLQKGIDHFQKGEFEEALEKLNAHLSEAGSDVKALFFRALTYRKLNRLQSSLKDLEIANQITKNDANIISERAVTLFHLGKKKEALADLNLAVLLEPENPYRYSSRAYMQEQLGYTKEAVEDYKKAIELDPEDAIAQNNLGLLEQKLGRMEAANQRFKKADDLVGYKPKEGAKEIPLPKKKQEKEKAAAPKYVIEDPVKKDTKSILKDLFTKKETRREFFRFILDGFKLK